MRDRPFPRCERRWLPGRLRAEIMLRQDGRCADCGTRLIMGFIVFDHRPPLALRDEHENANDPARLAAICWTCNEQKTPKDLKEIARTKRLAERHQDFRARQGDRVPGRRVPSRKQWTNTQRSIGLDHRPAISRDRPPALTPPSRPLVRLPGKGSKDPKS
ncbi:HNH endonuclease [Salinarimonas soli]|uniref:HNH endonuclease n=1 Tax=Salinarimonas soli TaxID=1638099 RepID=A0A5B2V758_9HYPH|nr:HNH endonuclease [Salinarimonas soli]KAA2234801.1 hypothetical protein F0L46_22905 [Salinarimonas soli]